MNSSVLVIFAIIVILLIILGIVGFEEYVKNRNVPSTPPALPNCDDFVDRSSLLVLTNDNSRSCKLSSSFFVPSINFVVAPFPVTANNVCLQFCDTLTNGNCVSATNPNAQSDYQNCLTTLTNSQCSGPLPIAIQNNILYYANSPTDITC
jgi:hypothetical protein